MGKIILIIALQISYLFNAQNIDKVQIGSSIISRDDIIIEFDKKDSIKIKKESDHSIGVYIYFEENIDYNKRNGLVLMNNIYDPSYEYCKECKIEMVYFMLEPVGKLKNKIIIPAKIWKRNNFEANYFKIGKKYYSYIGTVVQ